MDGTIKKLLGLVVVLGVLIIIVIPLFVVSIIHKKKKNEQQNASANAIDFAIAQNSLSLPKGCKVEDILLDNKVVVIKTDENCNQFAIGTIANNKVNIISIKKTN